MFSKPNGGWVDINIGGYILSASYLTDIPMDFLNSVISSLKNNLPVSIFVDEEGRENIICAFYDEVFIIAKEENGDLIEYKKIDMDFNLFRKSIIDDIEMNFNEWINWNMERDVEVLKAREDELRTKFPSEKYKQILKNYTEREEFLILNPYIADLIQAIIKKAQEKNYKIVLESALQDVAAFEKNTIDFIFNFICYIFYLFPSHIM